MASGWSARVRLWHVSAGGIPALLLGPLAIDPRVQGRGVGGGLMQVALNRAALAGHQAVILVGDPEYYERFGFSRGRRPRASSCRAGRPAAFSGGRVRTGRLAGAEGMIVATGRAAFGAEALAA